ncbi:uncharacterized protein LOC117804326 [Ailuropoda melanoleuca]|uniref:uncharacterized protein LOC117804326 n=1 Tax=Ailuropoda melanoleuca TaxID=9646 RepID=UPI0014940171|nr:uncharacterized protein LOC117804326 [Ailuropoda melanoleuca]
MTLNTLITTINADWNKKEQQNTLSMSINQPSGRSGAETSPISEHLGCNRVNPRGPAPLYSRLTVRDRVRGAAAAALPTPGPRRAPRHDGQGVPAGHRLPGQTSRRPVHNETDSVEESLSVRPLIGRPETKLIELNKEIEKSIIILGDFNTPLSTTDRMARQKIIDIEELRTINRLAFGWLETSDYSPEFSPPGKQSSGSTGFRKSLCKGKNRVKSTFEDLNRTAYLVLCRREDCFWIVDKVKKRTGSYLCPSLFEDLFDTRVFFSNLMSEI